MILRRTNHFVKQYNKLPIKIQQQFNDRLDLWLIEPNHPQLRTHPLIGTYHGYWSFNVTGDVRTLYFFEKEEVVVFALIGTHSQLYG